MIMQFEIHRRVTFGQHNDNKATPHLAQSTLCFRVLRTLTVFVTYAQR